VTYRIRIVSALVLPVIVSGCSSLWGMGYGQEVRTGTSSSLVDYLYPDGSVPPAQTETLPHLDLPLRVGIAFVPGRYSPDGISEAMKMSLLEGVKEQFVAQEYIAHIDVIPDAYLRSNKGIAGMQQAARLYGVDVMALVSYDQVAVSEDNNAAFLYWTIVGAYMVSGTDNEVQTFVDTAVFDVATGRLLFRAPGVDSRSDSSTAVESLQVRRVGSEDSFVAAVGDMSGNLAVVLERFEDDVRNNTARASVSWREGSGGGAAGPFLLLLFTGLLACKVLQVRRAA